MMRTFQSVCKIYSRLHSAKPIPSNIHSNRAPSANSRRVDVKSARASSPYRARSFIRFRAHPDRFQCTSGVCVLARRLISVFKRCRFWKERKKLHPHTFFGVLVFRRFSLLSCVRLMVNVRDAIREEPHRWPGSPFNGSYVSLLPPNAVIIEVPVITSILLTVGFQIPVERVSATRYRMYVAATFATSVTGNTKKTRTCTFAAAFYRPHEPLIRWLMMRFSPLTPGDVQFETVSNVKRSVSVQGTLRHVVLPQNIVVTQTQLELPLCYC